MTVAKTTVSATKPSNGSYYAWGASWTYRETNKSRGDRQSAALQGKEKVRKWANGDIADSQYLRAAQGSRWT